MRIGKSDAGEVQTVDISETGEALRKPELRFAQTEKSRPVALSALKRPRMCLATVSRASQSPRGALISRHSLAGEPVVISPSSSTPSFGGWFSKKSLGSKASSSSHNEASESNELPQFRLHHVPYVSQGNERMGCWYACARMVGHSVEAGPRLGLPELYNPQSGHDGLQDLAHAEQFILNEGLSKVDLPDSQEFSHEELGALLYRHGPIIFGWQTPRGNWHMSVLTGVDKHTGRVVFHDPQQGPDVTMPLSYFNQHLAWQVPHALLYR